MLTAAPQPDAPQPHDSQAPAGAYWNWRNFRVYYVRSGAGAVERPPLLLVHGFGASTEHWSKNIAQLQADFEVWAIDLIGFGRSSKPSEGYSSDLWRDQLSEFIREVIGRPAVLAGNSIGGYACLYVGASQVDWVKGVVLLNGVGGFQDARPAQEPNALQKALGNLIRDLILSPIPCWFVFQFVRQKAYIRKTLAQVYVNQAAITDELIEAIYRPACEPEAPAAFAALFKAPRGETVDALLARTQCPLLLLWGEADPWMNTRQRSELFRKYYTELEEHFLEAGHCPHDDRPELVNPLIRRWVLEVVGS
jgi:pimeloyl-ACP methyl ester carboxylesterase